MKNIEYNVKVLENVEIALETYKLVLECDFSNECYPGQFVNLKIDKFILRRPISISSIEEDRLVLVYKILGNGTNELTNVKKGDLINLLAPLGSGFPILEELNEVLIIGGGVGVPPLYEVAKRYRNLDKAVTVVLGFNTKEQVFYEEEFKNLGCKTYVATMDGSYGVRGTVIDLIEKENINEATVYSCGPNPLLRAVEAKYKEGYISLEARMACGVGACMACVCKEKGKDTSHRICKEGPVFKIGEVDYE